MSAQAVDLGAVAHEQRAGPGERIQRHVVPFLACAGHQQQRATADQQVVGRHRIGVAGKLQPLAGQAVGGQKDRSGVVRVRPGGFVHPHRRVRPGQGEVLRCRPGMQRRQEVFQRRGLRGHPLQVLVRLARPRDAAAVVEAQPAVRAHYRGERGEVTNYVAAFNDITQHKEAEEQIRLLAFSDPLTELPNRRLLLDRLEQAFAASARN